MEDIEQLAKMAQGDGGEGEEMSPEDLAAAQEKLKLLFDNYRSAQQAQGPGFQIHYSVYLMAFIVMFTVVGFFAYKLVKSIQDKEKKKEEKKKLKEMKKKK